MSFLSIENFGGKPNSTGVQKRETAKTDLSISSQVN